MDDTIAAGGSGGFGGFLSNLGQTFNGGLQTYFATWANVTQAKALAGLQHTPERLPSASQNPAGATLTVPRTSFDLGALMPLLLIGGVVLLVTRSNKGG